MKPLFNASFFDITIQIGREGPDSVRWTKQKEMMLSGGLAVFSVLLALLAGRMCCWLAALAMGVSTLGDALLAGYPERFAGINHRLTKGGAVFLAAHILYMGALLVSFGKDALSLLPRFALPFALFFGLTVLHGAMFYVRVRSAVPRAFFAAAFFYLLTVGVHAALAFTLSGQAGGGYILNAAGAFLFYLSDAILLAGKFGAFHGKDTTGLVWLTYVPAQLCILAGLFLAR